MYRILCYGDSNTWGFNPVSGLRFTEKERWPGVLRITLGDGFEVLEDGQNGRRIMGSLDLFESSVRENEPLDVVIIFLGINDLLFEKETKTGDLLNGIREMVLRLRDNFRDLHGVLPEVILIAAVPINSSQVVDGLYELEAEKVLRFSEGLRQLADTEGCGFIDSGRIIRSSEHDGVHLDASEHNRLGLFIADYMRTFLTNGNLNNRSR